MSIRLRALTMLVLAAALAGCVSSAERSAEAARKQRLIETQVQLGAGYLQRDQPELALENFKKALELDPDHPQANNMMALLQWRLKSHDEAEKYFRKALRARENDTPEVWNNYGAFLCDRGRYDESVKWFEKAAGTPMYRAAAGAYENAGSCLMRKPAPAAAEKYFREALGLDPNLPKSLQQMAQISYDAGRALSARGFMQRYFQAVGDTPEALALAVRIERALGNKNDEASFALRLRGKFPDSAEAKAFVAEARGAKGK